MELAEAKAMLARTLKVLRTLLAGLPEVCLHRNDGEGTWKRVRHSRASAQR